MPTRRADPNMVLAQQLGQGIARLFGPPDNRARMEYMQGASEIATNNARIDQLGAEAALDRQTYGNRAAFTPQAVADGMGVENSAMAQLIAASLGQGGNAQQAIAGLNAAIGGQRLAGAQGEGDARTGYALMGNDAPVDNALTGGGIADLFAQQTAIQDSKNATARYGHDASAAARRYAADQAAAAARYGHDNRLWSAAEGATLFDRDGNEVARGQPKGGGAGGVVSRVSPGDARALADEIFKALPEGVQVDRQQMAQATEYAAEVYRNTGDAGQAISAAAALFDVTPGEPAKEPWLWFNTPEVPPRAQFVPPAVFTPPDVTFNPQQGQPAAPTQMELSPEIQSLLDKYLVGGQ